MSSDFNQDSDNDLPDWLQGMDNGEDDASLEGGDLFGSGSDQEGDVPDWLQDIGSDDYVRDEDQEEVPEWLAGIRDEEGEESPTFMDEEPPEEDSEAWLDSIRERHRAETERLSDPSLLEDQGDADFMEHIRDLKTQDEQTLDESEDDGWDSPDEEEPQDAIAAAWAADTGGLTDDMLEAEDDVPDWLSGLPSLDPAEPPEAADEEEAQPVPDWLQIIRQDSEIAGVPDEKPEEVQEAGPEEVEEPEEEALEDSDGLPHVSPLSEPPPDTGSLPRWLENLQTAGLVLPADMQEESPETIGEEAEAEPVYDKSEFIQEEDVSSILLEADDLPDWLGEAVEEEEEEEAEAVSPLTHQMEEDEFDGEIEKAELPTWLQAMRPVEAVAADADFEEDEPTSRAEEKVGPLSGLSDVLPAEPHVVHFGSEATPIPGFTQTDSQRRYAKLLLSLVEEETKSGPIERRAVALPQKLLRWAIAAVLLVVLVLVLWFNLDLFGMPAANVPPENMAVVSAVNELSQGQKVLVAFEYQPALAGEMEAASAAILDHLLLKGVDLVLFSSQPTGPGLAEAFLQRIFADYPYIQQRGYVNLGYLSGGSAALLNFASSPAHAMPLQDASGQSLWGQAPLAGITTINDFSLVLVITDNPDLARSWVEQVSRFLDPAGGSSGTPLVMAISAQAEPLVYPYYITSPRQVTGYVSGIGGGAYYENMTTQTSLANKYWDAYNIGLMLTALVIALGAVFNLIGKSIGRKDRGRS